MLLISKQISIHICPNGQHGVVVHHIVSDQGIEFALETLNVSIMALSAQEMTERKFDLSKVSYFELRTSKQSVHQ